MSRPCTATAQYSTIQIFPIVGYLEEQSLSFTTATTIFYNTNISHSWIFTGLGVLFRSERIILLRSFKECNILLRYFFEFLATYETQKNDEFFSVLFLRT